MSPSAKDYRQSIAAEVRIYEHCLDVHSLPPVFHYWSNRHLLPALQAMGTAGPAELFAQNLSKHFAGSSPETRRFVSLGSGNCDLEIGLALRLRAEGNTEFLLDCVDLNPAMLERGKLAAESTGLLHNFSFIEADFNSWSPPSEYHAVIANQSLHHVVGLEHLFGEIKRSLRPGGTFIISDIIGRNGHLRWPEALEIVRHFWRSLPPSYRWNRSSGAYEEIFEDHDCSGEGFEGVRSQDILPLLLDAFRFQFFFPFGNVIDPFIDRSFGPNFDPSCSADRAFIDRVHQSDELEMAAGNITPTHMMAVVSKESPMGCLFPGNLSAEFCARQSHGRSKPFALYSGPVYQWEKWPKTPKEELDRACEMLTASATLIHKQTAWALSLEREAGQRLAWGLDLEEQLERRTQWALKLDSDLRARTAWALHLKGEIAHLTHWVKLLESWAGDLQADVEDRTSWAQRLERELDEKTQWALSLRADLALQTERADRQARDIHGYVRNPLRLLIRIAAAARNRLFGRSR